MKKHNQTKAFSIIELLIVLAVIGILAAILIPLLSDVISKGNAKSALSDAKNTLTNYLAQYQGKGKLCDSIIIIEKAGYYYTYGYILSANKLYESVNQPYKINDNKQIDAYIQKLLLDGDIIITADETQENITNEIKDVSKNVHVYKGYTLLSIINLLNLSESHIDIALGETYSLNAELSPE